ncbi:LapA family protein [Puteibacter caeruleilacunae]|nr:LapA family protein [Puteibacter caeruleilacunae]
MAQLPSFFSILEKTKLFVMSKKLILSLLIALLVVIFAIQNAEIISIKIYFWEIAEIPLAIVIFGTLLIGALISAAISSTIHFKQNQKIKKLERQLDEQAKKMPQKEDLDDEGSEIKPSEGMSFFED